MYSYLNKSTFTKHTSRLYFFIISPGIFLNFHKVLGPDLNKIEKKIQYVHRTSSFSKMSRGSATSINFIFGQQALPRREFDSATESIKRFAKVQSESRVSAREFALLYARPMYENYGYDPLDNRFRMCSYGSSRMNKLENLGT